MDILIILTIFYLLLAYFNKILRVSQRHKKLYNTLMLLSLMIVLAGCLTPFYFIYAFLISYAVLFVNFLIAKYFNRKTNDY